MSAHRVMKFGGTSVGSPQRLERAIALIANERKAGLIAVTVSAMGHSTDHLIEAAEVAAAGELDAALEIVDRVADTATTNGLMVWQALGDGEHPPITRKVRELIAPLQKVIHGMSLLREKTAQTLDLVLSFGERLSATILADLLEHAGVPAVYVDARTWTVTDDHFGEARVDWPATAAKLQALMAEWGERVPVTTGFLGSTPDGRTTTLGRNGSDYTATLLARGLGAQEVAIWTDVSGVMTADPGIVADAYPIARLSYLEALELASFGARMFHPRTMIPLIESGVPMRICNTMHPDAPGTRIDTSGDDSGGPISVTSLENLALLDVRWRQLSQQAQVGRRVLNALEAANVTVWMASQSAHGQAVAVVVPEGQLEVAKAAITEALDLEQGDAEPLGVRAPVTLLSLVAERMDRAGNVAGRFFDALGAVGVNVLAIAQGASSRSISCAIDADSTPIAVRNVHAAFNFAHAKVSVFVFGKGTVGRPLLEQIAAQRGSLERDHDLDVRVVGIADSKGAIYDADGLPLDDLDALLIRDREAVPEPELLDRLRRLPVPILVDCTAADGMEALYRQAFERGIHVAAANKKPLTIPATDCESLLACARKHHARYLYETTVGASLPVIDTLKDLVRTGDRVLLVEGSFSGTLGYLTNELMRGVPLSEAVEGAKRLGYTEPNPADDLSGLDVARKALILARELGLAADVDDIELEPLVPAALMDAPDVDAFFDALRGHDATMSAEIEALKAEGKTLRYLARIDPAAKSISVGRVAIDADHPATRLRGSEAFIAFTTERYQAYPLIVRGPGAGGDVTAAGVLADVLRIAQTLRGR